MIIVAMTAFMIINPKCIFNIGFCYFPAMQFLFTYSPVLRLIRFRSSAMSFQNLNSQQLYVRSPIRYERKGFNVYPVLKITQVTILYGIGLLVISIYIEAMHR